MNDNIGNVQQGTNQNGIRLGIALLVIVVIIGSVIIMNKKEKEKELTFNYAGATVKWANESNIQINFNSSMNFFNVRVIGIHEDSNHEVEKYNNTINAESNVTFYIEDMIDDGMEIWIEIDNVSLDVKEKQKWM